MEENFKTKQSTEPRQESETSINCDSEDRQKILVSLIYNSPINI